VAAKATLLPSAEGLTGKITPLTHHVHADGRPSVHHTRAIRSWRRMVGAAR